MANKLSLINGILLIFLNFFAVIPLGIYLSSGLTSYAGIPLYVVDYNNIQAFFWGMLDGSSSSWWISMGTPGIISFVAFQLPLIVACILIITSSYSKSKLASRGALISLILEILVLVLMILDMVLGGKYLGLNSAIPFAQIFTSAGFGFYFLILSIILEITVIRINSKAAESD